MLAIDKPSGCTSFDVIRQLRRALGIKKMGHAGTLDPMATGLLLIGMGSATKQLGHYQALRKIYTGRFLLGETRSSYDKETPILSTCSTAHLSTSDLFALLRSFSGEIEQYPPPYSARKVQGKRAYQLARQGISFELKPSRIHIYELEWTQLQLPWVEFRVVCSKGTYIRSMVHDIGQHLGVGAVLHALRRVAIGDITLAHAVPLDHFAVARKRSATALSMDK